MFFFLNFLQGVFYTFVQVMKQNVSRLVCVRLNSLRILPLLIMVVVIFDPFRLMIHVCSMYVVCPVFSSFYQVSTCLRSH